MAQTEHDRKQSELKWLHWAQQIQQLAQAGLTYSKDVYDIERFTELRRLSVEIMSEYTDAPMEKVTELFASESGYQTPKIDVRGAVFRGDKVLLVRETTDGLWTLPGGWADIGDSAGEAVVKEVEQEAGLIVEPFKLAALIDRTKHPHPPHPNHIYKIMFLCRELGGELRGSIETSEVGFFGLDELPPLSVDRTLEAQIRLMYEHLTDPTRPTDFD